MRNMSFFATPAQFRARTKTVTRRGAWWFLKSGDIVMGVEKSQGLGKGGKIVRMGPIRIVSTRTEPLSDITQDDVIAEGFPDWTPSNFIDSYMKAYKCGEDEPVNRIEFEYLEPENAV